MSEGYEKYLKAIENKNPVSEAQWREAIGIVDEAEQHEPLQIRPKKDSRPIMATFDNYIEKKSKVAVPKKRKPLTAEQKKAQNRAKKEWNKRKRREDPNFKERTDLSQMTIEQVKAHRAKQRRERRNAKINNL